MARLILQLAPYLGICHEIANKAYGVLEDAQLAAKTGIGFLEIQNPDRLRQVPCAASRG